MEAKSKFTRAEITAFEAHGWWCHYCGSTEHLTTDHKIPKSKGGTDAAENLLPACRRCNSAKRNRSYDEFIEYLEIKRVTACANAMVEDCL